MVVSERYRRPPRGAAFLVRDLSEREPAQREGNHACKSRLHHRQSPFVRTRNRGYHMGSRLSLNLESRDQPSCPVNASCQLTAAKLWSLSSRKHLTHQPPFEGSRKRSNIRGGGADAAQQTGARFSRGPRGRDDFGVRGRKPFDANARLFPDDPYRDEHWLWRRGDRV